MYDACECVCLCVSLVAFLAVSVACARVCCVHRARIIDGSHHLSRGIAHANAHACVIRAHASTLVAVHACGNWPKTEDNNIWATRGPLRTPSSGTCARARVASINMSPCACVHACAPGFVLLPYTRKHILHTRNSPRRVRMFSYFYLLSVRIG